MTRPPTTLIDARTAAVNRLHKVLEDANIKLASVASDVMGVSGRAILAALLAGTAAPAALADLAKGKLRTKRAALARALEGPVSDHHRLLLTTHLAHVDFLGEEVARLNEAIAARLAPFAAALARLATIPGVDRQTAAVLVAASGTAMGRCPTAGQLASWAGMCPGNHESGGKRQGGETRQGSTWLRRALIAAAHGAARTKRAGRTGLARREQRLLVRRGKQQAAVALG